MSCVKNTTKKYSTRPGPPYPAQLCRGLTKEGNDGQMYVSTANAKGVYQWKKKTYTIKEYTRLYNKVNSIKLSRKSSRKISRTKSRTKSRKISRTKSRKTSRTKSRKSSRTIQPFVRRSSARLKITKSITEDERAKDEKKGYHYIIHTEPRTLRTERLRKPDYKDFLPIPITPKFYKELKKAPKKISNFIDPTIPEPLHAYIFGKKYPPLHYKFFTGHRNDASQTGLIDTTIWRQNPTDFSDSKSSNWWTKTFKPYKWQWDNREALKKVQAKHPSILFLGDTLGDGGANLFVHRNSKDEIDSIAIAF